MTVAAVRGGGKHPPYGRYASCPHRTHESLPLEGKVVSEANRMRWR